MKAKKIEHIGIAVNSLDDSIKFYEDVFGLKCYAVEKVEDQKVRTAFFKIGDTKIELLESTDPGKAGLIDKFIEKRGEGIHHIAFEVEDLPGALKEIEGKGIQLIDGEPHEGAEGLDVAFLHPKSSHGVLIELCEKNQSEL
jgi:methylmalonyl-CoA/ethylmalonyl-CoA epimerase